MTQHVRTGYRRHRTYVWAVAVVVFAAAALAVVLPAVGANGDPIPPPSDPVGVLPTENSLSGSTFTCSSLSTPHASQQWQIDSLTAGATTTYTLTATTGQTAKLTIRVADGNNQTNDKYMSFHIVGGRISDIGLKGGAKTAVYHYGNSPAQWVDADGYAGLNGSAGTVNADGSVSGLTVEAGDTDHDGRTGLHATLDNQGKLYQLSWTTVCWDPVVKIEGTIYRDTNGDGSTTGDSAIAHQVSLNGGAPITTGSDGKYSFVVPSGGNYLVCAPAASNEVQTKPNDHDGSTNACTDADGYSFTNLTTDQTGKDFAFSGGITASCASGNLFESQINSSDANAIDRARFYYFGSSCKADDKQFVFTTYTDGTSRRAKLQAVSPLGGDCQPNGDGCQIVAERITWSFTGSSPDVKTLSYDDTADGGSSGVMQFCKVDPFDYTASDGVTLLPDLVPSDILPSGQSSCLARTTQFGPPGAASRVDQTYSAYDSTKIVG
jgi:hypothetical protein